MMVRTEKHLLDTKPGRLLVHGLAPCEIGSGHKMLQTNHACLPFLPEDRRGLKTARKLDIKQQQKVTFISSYPQSAIKKMWTRQLHPTLCLEFPSELNSNMKSISTRVCTRVPRSAGVERCWHCLCKIQLLLLVGTFFKEINQRSRIASFCQKRMMHMGASREGPSCSLDIIKKHILLYRQGHLLPARTPAQHPLRVLFALVFLYLRGPVKGAPLQQSWPPSRVIREVLKTSNSSFQLTRRPTDPMFFKRRNSMSSIFLWGVLGVKNAQKQPPPKKNNI